MPGSLWEQKMRRIVYVKGVEVTGCVVYDDAIPVKMNCENCAVRGTCIYKEIVFEKED